MAWIQPPQEHRKRPALAVLISPPLAPLYGFPDNGAFALIARSLPPPPICAGRGENCFASAPAPIQLPTVSSGQIRKRVRICRRCARVRMSAAGVSWTHPIRPFGGVRCFYAGGCGSLAGETARNRAADQIRQRCRICRLLPVSPWGKNLARMGPCGLVTYGPKHSCPGEVLAVGPCAPAPVPMRAQGSRWLHENSRRKTSRFFGFSPFSPLGRFSHTRQCLRSCTHVP